MSKPPPPPITGIEPSKRDLQRQFPLLSLFVETVSFEDCTNIFSSVEEMFGTKYPGGYVLKELDRGKLAREAREFEKRFPAADQEARRQAFWSLGANVAHPTHVDRVIYGLIGSQSH
ncbi:MAG: hypothetical protein CL510_06660 [Actinobacteria bacterium]|nr:hypothetical protein [Actinomycetota bacterium]|tara:strand:+ start:191 stop:541 length:351 start_codon:yes stop_codon:yes gene_type:complete